MDNPSVYFDTDSIVDDTLNTLRDQRDDAAAGEAHGVVDFSPQIFNAPSKLSLVLGPFSFDTPFQSIPEATFGQVAFVNDPTSDVTGIPTAYQPFVIHPYVFKWRNSNGRVDGFWMGLYAVSGLPKNGETQHRVCWRMIGTASAYADQNLEESWQEPYDQNDMDFLSEDIDVSDDDGIEEV